MDTVGHTGAAHIAKLIFAALVAFVPEEDPHVWLAIQRLRASGHITVPGISEATLDIRNTIAKSLKIMDAFEDDMAHALLKKATSGLAARIHLPDSRILQTPRDEQKDSSPAPDVITLLIRGLIDPEAVAVILSAPNGTPTLGDGPLLRSVTSEIPSYQQVNGNTKIHLEILVEWLRGILLKEWDGNAEVPKCSALGGALELLDCIYNYYGGRLINLDVFRTSYVSERLDILDVPMKYMEFALHDSHVHILRYSFLFPPSTLVSYFRAINHATMSKASETAMANTSLAMQMTFANSNSSGRGRLTLEDRFSKLTDHYLVVNIRREHVLTDAMDQLWRRQKRELMRPLKVRLGQNEGEEGVDHGGVQQEFFRVAIAEALDPKYGAFTTDPVTRMSWFQVGSLEPSYKYELLGILVSVAVYNGLTLPFTFPLAMYMKLLHHKPDHIEDIADGWPDLAKGLGALRAWKHGDVEDVFMRDYVFSVDVFGKTLNIDMSEQSTQLPAGPKRVSEEAKPKTSDQQPPGARRQHKSSQARQSSPNHVYNDFPQDGDSHENYEKGRQPSSSSNSDVQHTPPSSSHSSRQSSPTPPMVTNANRYEYIYDYIHHLTDTSIRPQYEAFAAGFTTCISPRSLSLFTPRALKELVEGFPHIDTHELEAVATYEGGYHARHHLIRDFWSIVNGWADNGGETGQDKVRHLLEFVTASDRLPVGGMTRVIFVIQKNGVGDERLPTSLTCFGRLLLPEFSSKVVMEEMLGKAVENSKGFGQP